MFFPEAYFLSSNFPQFNSKGNIVDGAPLTPSYLLLLRLTEFVDTASVPIQTGEILEKTRTIIKVLGIKYKKLIYTDHSTSSSKVLDLKQDSKTSNCSQENLRNPFLQLSQLSIIFINIIILTIIFFLL